MEIPFVGPSYDLLTRQSGVQRTINLIPVQQEPGNERTAWVFEDAPGLEAWSPADVESPCVFLDTFTGASVAAESHTPDTAPTGFAYAQAGAGPNTTLETNGAGQLIGVEVGYGTAGVIDSSASSPAPDFTMTIPYTMQVTMRPSATLNSSVVSVEFNYSADSLNTRLYVSIERDGSGNYTANVEAENYSEGGGDGWAFWSTPTDGAEHTISVYVSGTTFAVSLDGAAAEPPDSVGTENLPTAFNNVEIFVDTDSPFASDNSYIDSISLCNGVT